MFISERYFIHVRKFIVLAGSGLKARKTLDCTRCEWRICSKEWIVMDDDRIVLRFINKALSLKIQAFHTTAPVLGVASPIAHQKSHLLIFAPPLPHLSQLLLFLQPARHQTDKTSPKPSSPRASQFFVAKTLIAKNFANFSPRRTHTQHSEAHLSQRSLKTLLILYKTHFPRTPRYLRVYVHRKPQDLRYVMIAPLLLPSPPSISTQFTCRGCCAYYTRCCPAIRKPRAIHIRSTRGQVS